jgi:hypothetical protein
MFNDPTGLTSESTQSSTSTSPSFEEYENRFRELEKKMSNPPKPRENTQSGDKKNEKQTEKKYPLPKREDYEPESWEKMKADFSFIFLSDEGSVFNRTLDLFLYNFSNSSPEDQEQFLLSITPIGAVSKYGKKVLGVSDDLLKGGKNLTKSQLKSIASLKEQIAKHETKLAEYIKDPYRFDNKGFLKNAPNDEVRQNIIRTRIKHLKQEIETFKENIQKIINQGG